MLTVDQVDKAVAGWGQGDVADLVELSWLADTTLPLTAVSAEGPTDGGSRAIVVSEVDEMVVVTQTCDVVRSCTDRPFVQLCPVVYLEGQVASEAEKGMRPRYAHLPGIGDTAFADLDRVVTVEKSLLATAARREGCVTDKARRRFGATLGRKYARIAFPNDLNTSLKGLVGRLRSKHPRDSEEGSALRCLSQIRVTGSPSWSSDEIDVFLTFSPDTRGEALSVMSDEAWDQLVDTWIDRCEPTGVIAQVDGAMIPLEELTALEYLESDRLDLDHLSN